MSWKCLNHTYIYLKICLTFLVKILCALCRSLLSKWRFKISGRYTYFPNCSIFQRNIFKKCISQATFSCQMLVLSSCISGPNILSKVQYERIYQNEVLEFARCEKNMLFKIVNGQHLRQSFEVEAPTFCALYVPHLPTDFMNLCQAVYKIKNSFWQQNGFKFVTCDNIF